MSESRPDVVLIVTDEERAAPPYESAETTQWRAEQLPARRWFAENGVSFGRHYTGATACVPSRPTLFTGQYPDVHGVTQTDGLGKQHNDTRMRWLAAGQVPTMGHWFRAAGYDTHFDGKWHVSHADLMDESGQPVPTNRSDGTVLPDNVAKYLEANPLGPYGFDGWVGPEPHGGRVRDSGYVRDPLIAERTVAWLEDRYARRAAGDADAQKPFLLVCCFVNPHDIVLWPLLQRKNFLPDDPFDVPAISPSPTDDEDLKDKPAAQIAYRDAYASGYGVAPLINRVYQRDGYRELYYRLHAEVDGPIDRVRRTITGADHHTVMALTSDHGDLLGSHGGLHQKWYQLYDEATHIPLYVVDTDRVEGGTHVDMPTVHVDITPTLLGLAGLREADLVDTVRATHTEVHPLPGRDLTDVVLDPAKADLARPVYFMSRDNMLEGDSLLSAMAQARGRRTGPPPMQITLPAHVGFNFEAIVARVDGTLYKLVRTYDDPTTWTDPGVRQITANGVGGEKHRTEPLADQWELYDLDGDPIERHNRWGDPALAAVQPQLVATLDAERARVNVARNEPWPYAARRPWANPKVAPPPPARAARRVAQKAGLHPHDPTPFTGDLSGRRALIVCTSHGVLDIGKPTGVFASEMTAPYYVFTDAGLNVDLASPNGGDIPIDPQSLKAVPRSEHDDRFLADPELKTMVRHSMTVADVDFSAYDIIFLAGGWGAAFDLGFSEALGEGITVANDAGKIIGGVCHGPLGLLQAKTADGRPLVAGRRISAVTDKQVHELGIESTPMHPETELRAAGADFRCSHHKRRDALANHWEVDGNLVTGQNQNAGPMVAREMLQLLAFRLATEAATTPA
ncbi:MAG: sulfatase-like hydrolase/transferase [Acidimicrobiales bacterium]|nr:sulfatase-like hydrolase/transferase [Acidimicrobiales bacterium]